MVSVRDLRLLEYIDRQVAETGIAPSTREMVHECGYSSTSQAHKAVIALGKAGMIRRLPHRARAIEIVRPPLAHPPASIDPLVMIDDYEPIRFGLAPVWHKRGSHPVMASMAPTPSSYFSAVVDTDAMAAAGIFPGDRAILRRAAWAASGDVVIAVIADTDIVFGRFRQHRGSVAIEYALRTGTETRILPAFSVRFIGKLETLLRQAAPVAEGAS